MFKITTEEPKWSPDHAAALRQFLNGAAGQVFLQRIFWLRPVLGTLPAGPAATIDPTKRAAEAEQQAGYERAIQDIINLTVSPE